MLPGFAQFFEQEQAAPLPYDAEVEYIESTRTQYIDTLISNLAVSSSLALNMRVQFPTTVSSGYCGSGYTTSSSAQMFYGLNANNSTGIYMACNGRIDGSIASNLSQDKTAWHTISAIAYAGNVEYFFDMINILSTSFRSFRLAGFLLFAMRGDTANAISGKGNQRISSAKLTVDGVDIFDFIPVRVGTVGYMYDRVSGTLFGNAGTGDFVIGPDKS